TVKTIVPGVKRDFIFEVISPSESFILQAENQTEKDRWVQVIQNAISQELSRDNPTITRQGAESPRSGTPSKPNGRHRATSLNESKKSGTIFHEATKADLQVELQGIHESNH